ncbi:MAG: hypothetical protein IPJ60_15160 [Sphingobacteriaceae bacterium]|nr:hypothetical protein [Sphingobacteriaceae bacterium]
MKANILIASLSILLLSSCGKSKQDPCFDSKKEEFKKTCCSNSANIEEYTFQGKTVYVYEPGNCGADMTSEVRMKNVKPWDTLVALPGITRSTVKIFANAKFVKTVWSN